MMNYTQHPCVVIKLHTNLLKAIFYLKSLNIIKQWPLVHILELLLCFELLKIKVGNVVK